ncbi:hypothetical protein [Methanothermococcus okinawensis]|uniref:Uncharacterized protein n=1 Tax=Methanothermococcus okinawensis (strain DSM 14208 / JCM 11175 / IH1) TaxID=647113 RepID=F8ANU5_METOI|nr:hypothetical protein [Methanothermococcus okinawensis]AEH06299.1 hypothetical protein Metok_0309 [Methanothermococcus okinawensis IH1]
MATQREYIENAITEITDITNHSNDLYDIFKTIKLKIYTPNLPEPPELVKKRINEFEGKLLDIDHDDWNGDSIVGKFLKTWWDDSTNEGFAEVGIFNKAKAVVDLIKEGKIKYFSPSFWITYLGENIIDVLPKGGALCQYTIPDDPDCGVIDHSRRKNMDDEMIKKIMEENTLLKQQLEEKEKQIQSVSASHSKTIGELKAEHSKELKAAEERGFKKAKTLLELHSKYNIDEEVEKQLIEAIDNNDALKVAELVHSLKPKENDALAVGEGNHSNNMSPEEYLQKLRNGEL